MRWRVILERKFSTAFSREADVGVKWMVQSRPRRSSGRLAFAEGVGTRAAVRNGPVGQPRPSDRLPQRADRNERHRPAVLAPPNRPPPPPPPPPHSSPPTPPL